MDNQNYTYYLITGDPLLSKFKAWEARKTECRAQMRALAEKYGATNAFGAYDGISGLQFSENPPDGWVRYRASGQAYYRPGKRMPNYRELKAELNAVCIPDQMMFQNEITGSVDPFMFAYSNLRTGGIGCEVEGDVRILLYPKPKGGFMHSDEKRWQVPVEGVKELTPAEYYRIRAEVEERKTA